MNAKLERITPETAAQMLQLNTENRPVVAKHVAFLAREIISGRWQVNGDTICFSDDRLVDGQHRLMAIVKSGVPVQTFVIRGVSSQCFATKDTGKKRSTSDVMAINHVNDSKRIATATYKVWLYKTTGHMAQNSISPSPAELMDFYNQNQGIKDSVIAIPGKQKLIIHSLASALHYLFSEKDPSEADKFWNDVIQGENLQSNDSVFQFRARLVNNAASKSKLPMAYISMLAIKAWNFRREGRYSKVLRFANVGEKQEAYPVIK
jgi:hypothetical protein